MMNRQKQQHFTLFRYLIILTTVFLSLLTGSALALDLTVTGVNKDGTETNLTEFRWVLEQDDTYHVQFDEITGQPIPDPETLAVNFHRSYMPVIASGDQTTIGGLVLPDPSQHYYLSVLPNQAGTYALGGVSIPPGAASATVHLNQLPIPTAQIKVFVFGDTAPINSAPDLPEEQGLAGFQILLEDGGGRYGASAGAQMTDAFGNVLGTQYDMTCDDLGQNPGTGSSGCLDADGVPIVSVDNQGNPIVEPLITGADGYLTIKNLAPGKYGVQAVPPAGSSYQQTSTIEGSKVIDAWVKANEPPYFAEFGPAGVHVFIGFVQPFVDSTVLTGGETITGTITNQHLSRAPDTAFYSGAPFEHTTPWVGLNSNAGQAGSSRGLFATRVNEDGSFHIPNVPPGDYQLAIWDDNMDIVFGFQGITVNPIATGGCATPNGTCSLGDVPVFQWFTRLENWVFNDMNENGMRDAGEQGILEQAVTLRWRDGTLYQSMPTDLDGYVPFDQVFPFFAWQVAEVDFARFKATGATVYVDDGGAVDYIAGAEVDVVRGQLNTQAQGNPLDPDSVLTTEDYRVETGPVLAQAFQGFLGQTSVIEWGKKAYGPDENGGISGIVYYSTTRAEDDPKDGAAEPWEPGIPGVTVNLYDDTGLILLNSTTTDSWDDTPPQNCQYGSSSVEPFNFMGTDRDCFDGMRNWNQVRPGVFDGGYAFDSIFVDVDGNPVALGTADAEEVPMPPGSYIVEVVPPTGYEVVKSEDRNVDFGENYIPSPQLLPPECVGEEYIVAGELTIFPGEPAPLAGQSLPLCDRKSILLSNGANAAADFFLFTPVPISAHIFGMILDDTANEFDPNSPQFGEKYAPPWMPIGIYDWTGRLITQTYSDQYGRFNALVPSTFTTNLPAPSGMSPNMLTTCMNDSNPAADPQGMHNDQYSTFCYVFQYMPGATTYLDTPVVPVAAFAGPDQFPLDCELPAGEPRIFSVTNDANEGPFVNAAGESITITSLGLTKVPNPDYDGPDGIQPAVIDRDYGFGTVSGSVTIGGVPLTITGWADDIITGIVAEGTETGQLLVTRGDNLQTTTVGVTLQVGLSGSGGNVQQVIHVSPGVGPTQDIGPIQTAIDAANANDIIMVAPGVYDEMVVMWKPVRLQGWGAGSTTISAVKVPAEKLQAWRARVDQLVADNDVDLLPGQLGAPDGPEPGTLFAEEGAGVLVLARSGGPNRFGSNRNLGARIDGLTITSADTGGGIVVNGYAEHLRITNNRLINNSGFFGGGVRLGHANLGVDAHNDNILISHNDITRNGSLNGAGGGVSLYDGSDSYEVSNNHICGNFSLAHGGGIGHLGLSDVSSNRDPVPSINNNIIRYNQTFNQALSLNGGGIFIGGQAAVDGLTEGSGSVRVDANLIQGNQAAVGDGGGISLMQINGNDVNNRGVPQYRIDILNNMIVNNQAGLAGGGISLMDAAQVSIVLNTIAHNESTATAAGAFSPGNPNFSHPQPGGIVSRAHSTGLNGALANGASSFSDPQLVDNIIWENRSFYFYGEPGALPSEPGYYHLEPIVTAPADSAGEYWDLGVLGTATAEYLNPQFSVLTSLDEAPMVVDSSGTLVSPRVVTHAYDASNLTGDPLFIGSYFNGGPGTTVVPGESLTAFNVPIAFDEGGNFIQVRFGPLSPGTSDYHIQTGSSAADNGTDFTGWVPGETLDIDGDERPLGDGVDIGADELVPVIP